MLWGCAIDCTLRIFPESPTLFSALGTLPFLCMGASGTDMVVGTSRPVQRAIRNFGRKKSKEIKGATVEILGS